MPYGDTASPPGRGTAKVWPRAIPISPVVAIEIAV